MSNVDQVLAAALRLPATERAAVIAKLLDSLDDLGASDADVEQAWAEEAQRRLAEVDSGAVTPIPWSEVRRRLHAAASGRREAP